MLHLAIVICALILSVNGLTSCPERTPLDNFNVTRFAGTWYEIKSSSTPSLEAAKCVHNIFSKNIDGGLHIVGVFYSTQLSKYREFARDFSLPIDSTSGHFASGSISEFTVLGTDYETYTVIASCWKRNDTYNERLWVGAPSKTLSAEAETTVNALFPDVNWETTDQNDCPEHSHDHQH